MSQRRTPPPLPDPAILPPELVALPWVAVDLEKVPCNPRSGHRASPSDPKTGGTLAQALAFARRRPGWAVGVILTKDAGIVAVDIDKCIDIETGKLTPEAKAIVHRLPTYTEPSISGRGVHLYALGTLPPGGRKRGRVEMYDDARYVIVTGQPYEGRNQLTDCTAALAELHRDTFPPPAPAQPLTPSPVSIDTDALRERCAGSAKFRALFGGDLGEYDGDQSDGELAFCNIVVRNGGTPEQADALYRASALCRPKWDERRGAQTYGERTIARAFDGTVQPFHSRFIVNPQLADSSPPPLAATGTDDDLPDDVPTLKAMIVALTRRVEVAEQRSERAEARASAAERRADTLSLLQSKTTGIIRNNKLRQERFTAVALAYEFGNREAAGDPGDDGLYPIPLARIAEKAGISEDTASKHIASLAAEGTLRKELRWIPERIDQETGEIIPKHRRQFIGPASNVVDFVEAVTALDPKRTRKDGTEVGSWGGARTSCPDHPDAGTVKRWTLHCAECDRQLDAGEDHLDAEGTPQVADSYPSVDVYRCRNGGIDYNDMPAADGTVAGAWLHGAPLPGMSPPRPDRYTDPPLGAAP